jgi:UDP-GlcNAc:undecaprenyl-phosphate GlcNAc-1-phosphate transferase
MGDGGSLFLGFAIAVIPLLSGKGSILPLVGPLTILMVPFLDVFASIIRRKRKGLHFFTPDKEHTHHKLLDFGFTNRQILSLVYSLTFLFAIISVYWTIEMNLLSFIMIISAWTSGVLIFLILDKKYENKIRSKRRLENIRLIS